MSPFTNPPEKSRQRLLVHSLAYGLAVLLCVGAAWYICRSAYISVSTAVSSWHFSAGNDVSLADVGLPAYPGAKQVDSNEDDNSASVTAMAGEVGLKVSVISFVSPDAPEKVLAFYRPALNKYGSVKDCTGENISVGHGSFSFHSSDDGDVNDSDDDDDNKGAASASSAAVLPPGHPVLRPDNGEIVLCNAEGMTALRAGRKSDLHLVSVKPEAKGGSRFSLIFVHLNMHGLKLD